MKKRKKYNLIGKSEKVTLGGTRKYLREHPDSPAGTASSMKMENILEVFGEWQSTDSDTELKTLDYGYNDN